MKRLLALACAFLVFAGGGLALWSHTSAADIRSLVQEKPYQEHMTDAQVKDVDFVLEALSGRLAAGDETKLLFGSFLLSRTNPGQK